MPYLKQSPATMVGDPFSSAPSSSSTSSRSRSSFNFSPPSAPPSSGFGTNPSFHFGRSPSRSSLFGSQSHSFGFNLFGKSSDGIPSAPPPSQNSSGLHTRSTVHLEELVDDEPVPDVELNSDDCNITNKNTETSSSIPVPIPQNNDRVENLPTISLKSLFSVPIKDHVRQSVITSAKTLAETLSKGLTSNNPISVKAEVLEDLDTLKHMAKAAKINDSSLSWIISKVEDFVEFADVVAKLEDAVDNTSLVKVSTDLSLCNELLFSDEAELSRLHETSSSMKVREKEILEMRAKLEKMEEDFATDQEELKNQTSQVENRIRLNKAKKQDLEEVEKAKVEELKLKRALLEEIAGVMTSFASSA